MQMIDVYAIAGVFRDNHQLALDLAAAGMPVDKVHDAAMVRENTAAFGHELPSDCVPMLTVLRTVCGFRC